MKYGKKHHWCVFLLDFYSYLHFSFQFIGLPAFFALFYHVTYITTMSVLQTLSFLMLIALLQVFLGHKWIEGNDPFSGPSKSDSTLFALVDLYNDVFIAPFHFMIILLLRLNFREDIRWQSDTELRKIMTRLQPTPWALLHVIGICSYVSVFCYCLQYDLLFLMYTLNMVSDT